MAPAPVVNEANRGGVEIASRGNTEAMPKASQSNGGGKSVATRGFLFDVWGYLWRRTPGASGRNPLGVRVV